MTFTSHGTRASITTGVEHGRLWGNVRALANTLREDLLRNSGASSRGEGGQGYFFLHLTLPECWPPTTLARLVNKKGVNEKGWEAKIAIDGQTATVHDLVDHKACGIPAGRRCCCCLRASSTTRRRGWPCWRTPRPNGPTRTAMTFSATGWRSPRVAWPRRRPPPATLRGAGGPHHLSRLRSLVAAHHVRQQPGRPASGRARFRRWASPTAG